MALSVDNSDAIAALIGLARSDDERRHELAFIEAELVRQVVAGDGLLEYLDAARPILEPEVLLESIAQAHRERPDLWHAWSALVSQLGHLRRFDEALVRAEEATRLFPHLPRTWLDLATVHRWRSDAPREIEAAERAFEIDPSWSVATLALTDALERSGRLDDARRTFERALQHSPDSASVHGAFAELLWRQRRSQDALAETERALRLAPAYEWAWQRLSEWSLQMGERDRSAAFARVLTGERPGDPESWLVLARRLAGAETISERLTALDRALAIDPSRTDAWDAKASVLGEAERFEAALEACTEGAARCRTDLHVLEARRASIEAARRRLPEAIQLMRAVLAENVSYVDGWYRLATWLLETDLAGEATTALEHLQRLCPHDAWVNRELGLLHLKQGATEAAAQAFSAALRIVPTDVQAAHRLINLQFDARDLDAAAATLELMQVHQPGPATLAIEVRLCLERHDDAGATSAFETLCASAHPDPWPIDAAAFAFQRAKRVKSALRILRAAIKKPGRNDEVGAAAVRLLLDRRSPAAATWLFTRLPGGEISRRAAAPLIEGLGETKSRLAFRWVLWRHRDAIRADDGSWGQTGLALVRFNRLSDAARWLRDWRERKSVEPWMVFNFCLGLRHLGRYGEATTVARFVLKHWGHREGAEDMHLFLAVEDALAGRIPDAEEHLARIEVRKGVEHDEQLFALAKALVEFQQLPLPERRRRFRETRTALDVHVGPLPLARAMRDVRRTFGRAVQLFHRNGGGVQARLWGAWNLYWYHLVLPLSILIWLWRRL
ncbi:MAG TPA: tetratricopeptide repeat protein [Vicinamibacterales bacterium]|nr:tetratricopeptide repeat protein [Vicinamibacterales bacterium]